jgi:hypothetical protein
MDHDRLTIICVFGSATGSIILLLASKLTISGDRNAWEKGKQ